MWSISLFFVVVSVLSANSLIVKSHQDQIFVTNENYQEIPINKYEATWESLDSRPLPKWFDDCKVGVFLHWGVFSVPAISNEWFWFNWKTSKNAAILKYMADNYPPRFTYQDFGRDFTAELYDPYHWVNIFKKSGVKYLVLTSKHHEGYTLWPSKYSFGWNAGDVGPKRDVLGDLADAVRNSSDIRFGLYHSWFEFYNPLYLTDRENGYTTSKFVKSKALPELLELVITSHAFVFLDITLTD